MTGEDTTPGGNGLLVRAILVLVHSNLLISSAGVSVAITTILLADLRLEAIPLFIVFAVTMFVYSFNHLTDVAEDRRNVPDRAAFVDRWGRSLLVVGTGLYVLATVLAIIAEVPRAPGMILPLVVAILYSVVGLKRVLLVKNLLVGLAWGLIPLGVGVYYGSLFSQDVLFVAGYVALMVTVAAMVFDIKDIEGDRAENTLTVPILVGPQTTGRIAAGVTILASAGLVALLATGTLGSRFGYLLAFNAYIFGYSLFATEDRTTVFYGFVVDGEHVFLAALLLFEEYVGLPLGL